MEQRDGHIDALRIQTEELQEACSKLSETNDLKAARIAELEEDLTNAATNLHRRNQEFFALEEEKDNLEREKDELAKSSSASTASKDKATIIEQRLKIQELEQTINSLRFASSGNRASAICGPCFAGEGCTAFKQGACPRAEWHLAQGHGKPRDEPATTDEGQAIGSSGQEIGRAHV